MWTELEGQETRPENLALFGDIDVETHFPFLNSTQLEDFYGRRTRWLVDGLLPEEGLAVLFGRYGSQKSFVAIHLAHCVALGRPFFGRETRKSQVLYIAAESPEDYSVRCRGWRSANGDSDAADNLAFLPKPVNFLDERQVGWLVHHDLRKMRMGFSPRLVIIDPLADCLIGGDENSSKDIGKVVSGIQSVARDLMALVLVIHHTGKDGQLRGHTILPSSAKTIIKAEAKTPERVTLTVQKQRSGSQGQQISLESAEVCLDDGQTTRTLTLKPDSPSLSDGNNWGEPKAEVAFRALTPDMRSSEWQRASHLKGGTFDRAKKRLLESGRVTLAEGRYSPVAAPLPADPTPTPSLEGVGGERSVGEGSLRVTP